MSTGLLNLIVACSENRVIGRNRRLPFDIPEDKEWFHQQTAGAACILGRICFETWPRVLADDREPVVITRNRALAGPRVHVVSDVRAAIATARTLGREIMICGGQKIYEETLPLADRLILTLVHTTIEGDTTFPDWRHLAWKETWRRESADPHYRYTFLILDRVR
jgi:dihydrofolate reductase